jgi:hypothetical protein
MGLGTNNDGNDTFNSVNNDCDTNICNIASLFDSINSNESISELLLMMKQSYMLFLLELCEAYLLLQSVTNIISMYILTLIRHFKILV